MDKGLIIHDIIDALNSVRENIKEHVSKYVIHSFTKEVVDSYYAINRNIRVILERLGLQINEFDEFYNDIFKFTTTYDLCVVSNYMEKEGLEKISVIIEELERVQFGGDISGKKTIRIKYVDFSPVFRSENHWTYKILSKNYNVIISDKPDYLFFSCFGTSYLKYDCIRIFISNEAVYPNFNLYDYAFTYSDFTVADRLLPNQDAFTNLKYRYLAQDKEEAKRLLDNKKEFCNFVYSNGNGDPYRTELFYAIGNYKKVLSGGCYLNNIGYRVENIETFQNNFKFSIACENSYYRGYTTEKLINAFNGRTIPIYWGDPNVVKYVNKDAFINCHDYESFDAIIEEIRRLDEDDDAYMAKLMQPILVDNDMPEKYERSRERFLCNIIEQPYSDAFRRNRCLRGQWYNDWFRFVLGYPNEWFSPEKDYFVKKKK